MTGGATTSSREVGNDPVTHIKETHRHTEMMLGGQTIGATYI